MGKDVPILFAIQVLKTSVVKTNFFMAFRMRDVVLMPSEIFFFHLQHNLRSQLSLTLTRPLNWSRDSLKAWFSLAHRHKQSKWKLGRHKHKHKKNGQVCSSCAYAYVVALTSENGVDISTRPWTNHRSLWPRPHTNISKAIWWTLRPPSCLSLSQICHSARAYVLMLMR